MVGVNQDILASRQAFVGTRDTQLRIGTVPVKPASGHPIVVSRSQGLALFWKCTSVDLSSSVFFGGNYQINKPNPSLTVSKCPELSMSNR